MGTKQRNAPLMVVVDTIDAKGETIGTRTVDMYHFGTREWLSNHTWWAMHNGHTIAQRPASE